MKRLLTNILLLMALLGTPLHLALGQDEAVAEVAARAETESSSLRHHGRISGHASGIS